MATARGRTNKRSHRRTQWAAKCHEVSVSHHLFICHVFINAVPRSELAKWNSPIVSDNPSSDAEHNGVKLTASFVIYWKGTWKQRKGGNIQKRIGQKATTTNFWQYFSLCHGNFKVWYNHCLKSACLRKPVNLSCKNQTLLHTKTVTWSVCNSHLIISQKSIKEINGLWVSDFFKLIKAFTSWGQRSVKPCFQRTLLCVIKLLFFPALQSIWPRLKQHLVSSLLPEHPPPPFFSALVHCVHTPGEHQPNSSSAPLVISLSLVLLSTRTCDFHSPSRTQMWGASNRQALFHFQEIFPFLSWSNSSPAQLCDSVWEVHRLDSKDLNVALIFKSWLIYIHVTEPMRPLHLD